MSAVWLLLSWRLSQHSSCLSLCLNNIHNTLELNLSWLIVLNLSQRSIILQISFSVPHPSSPNCLYFLVCVFTLKWRLDIDCFPLWCLLGVTFVSLLWTEQFLPYPRPASYTKWLDMHQKLEISLYPWKNPEPFTGDDHTKFLTQLQRTFEIFQTIAPQCCH